MSIKTTDELRAEILEEERTEREKKEDEKRKKLLKKEMKQKEKEEKKKALLENDASPTANIASWEGLFWGFFIGLIVSVLSIIIQVKIIPEISYRQDVKTGFCFAYTRTVHMVILGSDSLSLVPCTKEVLSHIPPMSVFQIKN